MLINRHKPTRLTIRSYTLFMTLTSNKLYEFNFKFISFFEHRLARLEKLQRSGVSRHHGGPIESPAPKKKKHSITVFWAGSRGTLNWVPNMPGDVILSDSRFNFFQVRPCLSHIRGHLSYPLIMPIVAAFGLSFLDNFYFILGFNYRIITFILDFNFKIKIFYFGL